MSRAECNLLRLREEFVNVPVKLKLSNVSDRQNILRPDLSSIKDIKVELVLAGFRADLDTESPSRELAIINGSVKVFAVEVRVLPTNLQRFVPYQGMYAKSRSEMELHKGSFTVRVRQGEGVNTESLHHPVGPWDTSIAHGPHEHMCGFRMQELEIPEVVVGGLSLWDFSIGFRFLYS